MIKPDWNIFKAKFSENPQSNFEWFCYLLFCLQYGKHYGIFRYKNQSGIETNPISIGKEVVGWQAKFYETTLSDNKNELIATLTKSKRDYPGINKIIFYSNQEWGQSHKTKKPHQNDPQAKIDIENTAKELNIQIDWRTASFFESPFVVIENKPIAQHFFSLEKSIIQLITEKQFHTEAILEEIQTSIAFRDVNIQINRDSLIQDIKNVIDKEQVLIVAGEGGVGKTSVIKKLYENMSLNTPFYIFKSSEFEITNINNLFDGYSFIDFVNIHQKDEKKLVVIDSAEKILDLERTDAFNEFISTLIKNGWKIIFTARSNYLTDLDMQFIDHYKVTPIKFFIEVLPMAELTGYALKYEFDLPIDNKLLDLLKNPFYLSEYLKFYSNEEVIDYQLFKEKVWNKLIKKSRPNREQCFMKIAFQRVNEGQFFISPDCDEVTISSLVQDGILGYEVTGYFITHDIYEEWALERIIESEYIKRVSLNNFFDKIGESLSIRRSFRKWFSDKLLIEDDVVETLIEDIIETEDIPHFWKDEVLVSVLLSQHSDYFINLFEKKLLDNNRDLLKRVTFLLRIACKEVDQDQLKLIGLDKYSISEMKYIFTKPKGKGWQSVINLIYKYRDSFELETINYILPIIYEWNSKFKSGETTRLASLIALKYYEVIFEKENYAYRGNESEEKLIQTILYGTSGIKDELSIIFDEVINNNWRKYRDPYYSLVNAVLCKLGENQEVLKFLPVYVLRLAELYWINPIEEHHRFYSRIGVSEDFCIDESSSDYSPSSAYQTPIYWLLKCSFRETIDFILRFVNKTVECYVNSDLDDTEVHEVEVIINDKVIKQYISNRLWNAYRGTQVTPKIFESIHMALEKFLLENSEHTDSEILENVLMYLIENSKSTSITAIVSSIVLANYEKTFNVAKVLFQTREFFFYDNSRRVLDQTAKSLFMLGFGLNYKEKIYREERITSCDDKHREKTLENIAVGYQFFRSEDINEAEADERMRSLWTIFDNYYKEIEEDLFEDNKTWRLFLARMDRRKMNPIIEEVDQGIQIDFNPELEPDLLDYRETAMQESAEKTKYLSLKLWATYKFENDDKYKDYHKYIRNPELALVEVKEILEELKSGMNNYDFLNKSIPAYVCTILLRDYFNNLSQIDKKFCKEIVLSYATLSFSSNYTYQIKDGVEAAISVLPIILKYFPEEKETIKCIFLFTLFDNHSIGAYADFSDYALNPILDELWDMSFEDAQSLLLGFLHLKPKYEDIRKELKRETFSNNQHRISEPDVLESFLEEYEIEVEKVIKNSISLDEIEDINNIHLSILSTAFQLIPSGTSNPIHKDLIKNVVTTFTEELLLSDISNRVDYKIEHEFYEKLSEIILSSSNEDIPQYLSPLLKKINSSESIADFLKEFVYIENRMRKYDNFWLVWDLLYEHIVELHSKHRYHYNVSLIIRSYLFADILWNEGITDWHTLKNQDKRFFMKATKDMGDSPAVLYSVVKLLNGIGQKFINNGISWISRMFSEHRSLWNVELEDDTIYYLEKVVKSYIHINREKIRREVKVKREVIILLDFLVEKGSVAGYMLRESIL